MPQMHACVKRLQAHPGAFGYAWIAKYVDAFYIGISVSYLVE